MIRIDTGEHGRDGERSRGMPGGEGTVHLPGWRVILEEIPMASTGGTGAGAQRLEDRSIEPGAEQRLGRQTRCLGEPIVMTEAPDEVAGADQRRTGRGVPEIGHPAPRSVGLARGEIFDMLLEF